MSSKTALIAGATGAAATRLVEVLLGDEGWQVIGVSRHAPRTSRPRYRHLCCDLSAPNDSKRALANCAEVTHVVYATRAEFGEGGVEDVGRNTALLRNLLDAIEAACPRLEHVHLVEGQKWYDVHLHPPRTPAREDDPRHMPPNFYYDQEDLLRERQSRARWSWSASRPMFIYDYSPERPRNIVSTVGVWAAICAELRIPLDFPGSPGCYSALTEMTDATQLANAISWMLTALAARNQAYNVTDMDVFRWERLWPRIAQAYAIPLGAVRPLKLAHWMSDKDELWSRIVRKHGLAATPIQALAPWGFADFVFGLDADIVSSTTKIRRAGFHGVVDTEEQFLAHLARYREARLLP
jgi:nucleoside-diphosphate-sugar epimerase